MRREIEKEYIEKAIQGVYSGSLAKQLKTNASYTLSGIGIGAISGFILASFFKQSRLVWGLGGAAIFGLGGLMVSKKVNDKK